MRYGRNGRVGDGSMVSVKWEKEWESYEGVKMKRRQGEKCENKENRSKVREVR